MACVPWAVNELLCSASADRDGGVASLASRRRKVLSSRMAKATSRLLGALLLALAVVCSSKAEQVDASIESSPADQLRAAQGEALAQWKLGIAYENGIVVPQDKREAAKWYRASADQGFALAQLSLGLMLASGQGGPQSFTRAAKWLTLAAKQGNAIAQLSLGVLYRDGRGVPRDDSEALKWWRLASAQRNSDAQFHLGMVYRDGVSVPRSPIVAADFFRIAANAGQIDAQAALGDMYFRGDGVPQDYILAHMWLNLAAAQGDATAAQSRMAVELIMSPPQVAEAQKLAREWKPKQERLQRLMPVMGNTSRKEN